MISGQNEPAMSDCPIEHTDEGGDPACWAHLFDDEVLECDEAPTESTDQLPAEAQAASGPESVREATRS